LASWSATIVLGVSGVVDPAGGDRGVVLVQRRPFPFELAGFSPRWYWQDRGTLVYRRLTRGERGRESVMQELATQV
jgi:hypothetical protein